MASTFISREGLCCVEVWLDEATPATSADVILYCQAPRPVTGARNRPFQTRVVDLCVSPSELLKSFDEHTRRKIRQSAKDADIQIDLIRNPASSDVDAFARFFNDFAGHKGIWPVWLPRIESYMRADILLLSRARQGDQTLIWHAGVCIDNRYVLLHSASHFRRADQDSRKLIGRNNRRLHYEEMLQLASEGFEVYDFCGWYSGTEDESLLTINRFKSGFGGRIVTEYNAFIDVSVRAKLTRTAKHMTRLLPAKAILSLVDKIHPR